jgi:hypothetical protein
LGNVTKITVVVAPSTPSTSFSSMFEMEDNIVENMKNIRANIYLYNLCNDDKQRKLLLKAINDVRISLD